MLLIIFCDHISYKKFSIEDVFLSHPFKYAERLQTKQYNIIVTQPTLHRYDNIIYNAIIIIGLLYNGYDKHLTKVVGKL